MVTWWIAVLLAVGFTLWTLFSIMIGAALVNSAQERQKKEHETKSRAAKQDPRFN